MKSHRICSLNRYLRRPPPEAAAKLIRLQTGLLSVVCCLFMCSALWSQKTFLADQVGRADYTRLIPKARGFHVYVDQQGRRFTYINNKYLYLLKQEIFNLEFQLKDSEIECGNCAAYAVTFRSDQSSDSTGIIVLVNQFRDSVSLDYRIGTGEMNEVSMSAPIDSLEPDPGKKYLALSNRFIHYASISDSVNIGLIDVNFNGIPDGEDLLSLSADTYFYTASGMLSCMRLDSVKVIDLHGTSYRFTMMAPRKWEFTLQRTDSTDYQNANIALTNHLSDFALGTTTIYQLLNEHPYIILDFFYEYSYQCDQAIPKLNAINDSIKVVGLLEYGSEFNSYLEMKGFLKTKGIAYECFALTDEIRRCFNTNGHPWYILVDDNHKIVGFSRDFSELLKLVNAELK